MTGAQQATREASEKNRDVGHGAHGKGLSCEANGIRPGRVRQAGTVPWVWEMAA